ncbi:MAG TPA: bifunctional demethylmenaquinone methyltransferase/2-methoxy-6-polyprenyl-1,4-benzoquinol methylase UbiE [Bryobacteraceae bacterium]|jgi:demethylmenaquinone methyltransferase/2-methoxy-6-polyprenyl-1,4-benzoquinol methylase|nr:bifunctional demethylmenaquinone methyltransferase/2-methoxy-6-polyprenyl-1,4-benzoquinol methylase UbiE [Bryobacteraceae bacterium]
MKGTTPEGVRSEQEAANWVRSMFGRVAPRYDLANHLLSFNIDRLWRARTVNRVRSVLERQGARALDICCGTGDLVMALQRACPRPVFGSDFCHPMLVAARDKVARQHAPSLLFEADALRLPVRDASLDLITVAFGFRNLANYADGLREMRRVLRPGGMAAILEFSQPPNAAFGAVYGIYSRRVLPWIGGLLTGNGDAYRYLPESIRKFPAAPELAADMRRAGFGSVTFERFTGGSVALHIGAAGG